MTHRCACLPCVCPPFGCVSLCVYVPSTCMYMYILSVCMSLSVYVPLCEYPLRLYVSFHVCVSLRVYFYFVCPSVCISSPYVVMSLRVYAPSCVFLFMCMSIRIYVPSCVCPLCISPPCVYSFHVYPSFICPFRGCMSSLFTLYYTCRKITLHLSNKLADLVPPLT